MISPQQDHRKLLNAAGIVLLLIVALGFVELFSLLFHGAARLLEWRPVSDFSRYLTTSVWPVLQVNATPIGTVAIALGTIFLWRANVWLARASEGQLAMTAPFIAVDFTIDDRRAPLPGINIDHKPDYLQKWIAEDRLNPNLNVFVGRTIPPRYVNVDVQNLQESPHGVAAYISVDIEVSWGGQDGDYTRPHKITRRFYVPALRANARVGGPVFDMGTLPGIKVSVTNVSYTDITRKSRRAAYCNGFDLWSTGYLKVLPCIMEPGRRELGNWLKK